jgi:hypothetical protein
MKKILIALILCGLTIFTKGQETSVEKSIFGVQTGLLGIWIHNESRLTNEISLRSELGFDSGIFGGSFYNKTGFIMTPVITAEPRWYYNLEKRVSKSKNIKNNSGDFIGMKISYNPDWFVISNYDNLKVVNQVSIIPKWGIRRVYGEHFSFEAGFGVGYRYIFAKSAGYLENESEVALDLHLRIGYNF